MRETNLCSQSNPSQYLCRKGILHINQKEMKILSMQKKSMKMIILLILKNIKKLEFVYPQST